MAGDIAATVTEKVLHGRTSRENKQNTKKHAQRSRRSLHLVPHNRMASLKENSM